MKVTTRINFEVPDSDQVFVDAILRRAKVTGEALRTLELDIKATHLNGTPLKLKQLAEAPPSDFYHDISGIQRHINRETGKLDPKFSPRHSA